MMDGVPSFVHALSVDNVVSLETRRVASVAAIVAEQQQQQQGRRANQ